MCSSLHAKVRILLSLITILAIISASMVSIVIRGKGAVR